MSECLEETTGSYRRIMGSTESDPGELASKSSTSNELDVTPELEHEVTPGSLEIWSDLPDEIKNDPSLAPFKSRYEKQYGPILVNSILSGDLQNSTNNELASDVDVSSPSTPNGISQHKVTSENNNIGSNSYYSKNMVDAESGVPKIRPALARQKSDVDNSSPTSMQSRASDSDDPSNKAKDSPKVSFLTPIVLDGSPNLNTLNKHDTSQQHQQDMLHHDDTDAVTGHKKTEPWMKNTKILILLISWIVFTTILLMKNEKVDMSRQISIPVNRSKTFFIVDHPIPKNILLTLSGPFVPEQYGKLSYSWLNIWVEAAEYSEPIDIQNISHLDHKLLVFEKNVSSLWRIPLVAGDMVDFVPVVEQSKTFDLEMIENISTTNSLIMIMMSTTQQVITPITISYNTHPINVEAGIIYAAIVLLGLYILIIFEIVHRTFAALLASTMSIAILAILGERPTTSELISWIDVETLLLLFSMMVIVAILSETGIFDYLAVLAYKMTGGRVWPLINCLCLFTAVMSSFLDNVTTVLLMTPVTIRLCEVMELNPVPILMSMIIFSNVGGTLTPVGDPPNVIIASNQQIQEAGINFTTFTMHMSIGILLVVVQTYIHIRYYFRDINSLRHSEPIEVQEMRHEISIWQRAASSLSSYSKDEDIVRATLMKKVNRLLTQLKKKMKSGKVGTATYKATLQELTDKYPIRDKVLLVKSTIAVIFVILFFFLHSLPELQRLSLGWTALLGALLLLILSDRNDMEAVLARVEWSTLLFFAALFILMEALSKLGLINWIGKQTENVIMSVSEDSRLAVAILLILWVSAVASAFVDNIPLTTMMIRIATDLGNNPELNLPMQPLIWALAFGACLGGNGTLIGASANVVCAGVAEQHGYRFSFMEYFKVGFPVMLGSVTVITGYLLVCHVVLEWH